MGLAPTRWLVANAFLAVLLSGCGTESATTTAATDPGTGSTEATFNQDFPEAREMVVEWVDGAAAAVVPDAEASEGGLGEWTCQPPTDGLVAFDYAVSVVVDPSDVHPTIRELWTHFEELGFVLTRERIEGSRPVLNFEGGDYGGQIQGVQDVGSVRVGITTGCFPQS